MTTTLQPSYTVPPPPFGFHLCFERVSRLWVAFWNAECVATGETPWDCRAAYDRWDTKRNAPQIRRLPCGRYELRVHGTARGVYETRREARAAVGR